MATKVGKDWSVRLGSTQILGIGTVEMSGAATDMIEDTEFGDEWKTTVSGLKDGGNITFSGVYKTADSTGQDQLRTYNDEGTNVTSLRVYVDNTSYWETDQTTVSSHVNITEWSISGDKEGVGQANFTAKVSGRMVFV